MAAQQTHRYQRIEYKVRGGAYCQSWQVVLKPHRPKLALLPVEKEGKTLASSDIVEELEKT